MTRSLALLAALTFAGSASAALSGTLYGIYNPPNTPLTNLQLLSINPNDATNATIATVNVGPISTTFPGKSMLNNDTNEIIVAVATSDGVYAFAVADGKRRQLAPLPAYNDSDPLTGVVYVQGNTYLITQYGFWSVAGGKVTKVASLSGFPSVAQVTVNPAGGTNGKGMVFVGQTEGAAYIYTIDLGANYAQGSFKASPRVLLPCDVMAQRMVG